MSLFDPPPHGSAGVVVSGHPAHTQLRIDSRRLRRRLLAVNVAVTVFVALLAYTLEGLLASAVRGAYTLGMLLLSVQAVAMLISAVWYDRACGTLCDPRVDALRNAVRVPRHRREQP